MKLVGKSLSLNFSIFELNITFPSFSSVCLSVLAILDSHFFPAIFLSHSLGTSSYLLPESFEEIFALNHHKTKAEPSVISSFKREDQRH